MQAARQRTGLASVWVLVAVLAATIRLAGLEQLPLDSSEARLALAALRGSAGEPFVYGPLLEHLTALNFWLFGGSDAALRLVPALVGVGIVALPSLLIPQLGVPAAVATGVLLAASPLAIDASRRGDPAVLTAGLALLVLVAVTRLATDWPRWAPWVLAAAGGLALAHTPDVILALVTALLAAGIASAALGRPRLEDGLRCFDRLRGEPRAVVVGGVLAVVAATGAGMDLRGLGHLVGDFWGRVPSTFSLVPASLGSLVGIAAYSGPLLLLAAPEVVRSVRTRDAFGVFLGLWAGLALLIATFFSGSGLASALLPTLPAALLGGRLFGRLPWPPRPMTGLGWVALALLTALVGTLLIGIADSFGASRSPARVGLVALALLVLLIASLIESGRRASISAGAPLATLAVALLLSAWSVSSVAHASFGAGPPGAEPFRPDPTAPAFRGVFRELNVIASGSSSIRLALGADPPAVGEWYGRAIPLAERGSGVGPSAIVIRPADDPRPGSDPGATRIPWRFRSTLKTDDVHPLGIARWLVTRRGLLEGQPEDVLVIRPQGG